MWALRTLGFVRVGMAPVLTATDKSSDRTSFGNGQALEAEGTEITHIPLVKWVPIAEGSQPDIGQ